MKNLNDLLTGRNAAHDFLAQRFLLNARDEILGDLEIDVRLQQREPHLPHRIIDVRLADRSVTTEILEDVLQLVAELRKHDESLTARCAVIVPSSSAGRLGSRLLVEPLRPERQVQPAGAAAVPSSILNVQCVSIFLPPDTALTITVHVLSRSRCVTWYDTVEFLAS